MRNQIFCPVCNARYSLEELKNIISQQVENGRSLMQCCDLVNSDTPDKESIVVTCTKNKQPKHRFVCYIKAKLGTDDQDNPYQKIFEYWKNNRDKRIRIGTLLEISIPRTSEEKPIDVMREKPETSTTSLDRGIGGLGRYL